MRATQLVDNGILADRDVVQPEPGPGDVLVRIDAAGVCRSDLHYRSGFPVIDPLPRTLGHEIAGTVVAAGEASGTQSGTRVCMHYLVTCGECSYCVAGTEQFCAAGNMLGKEVDGGFAEFIVVPERNAFAIPDEVSTTAAAVMMCSTATSFHALAVGGVDAGSHVAVFGAGGLGQSAVQLALHLGATVVAIDPNPRKRELAEAFGATAVDPGDNAVEAVAAVAPAGVDVALDLVGSPDVIRSALDLIAPMGRVVAVGLTSQTVDVGPYTDLVTGEKQLVGSSDHLASEIPQLLALAASGAVSVDDVITKTIPLAADAINGALDELASWGDEVRTVVEG